MRRALLVWVALGAAPLPLATAATAVSDRPEAGVGIQHASAAIAGPRTFRFNHPVTHLAVHWRANRGAKVAVALSRDGRQFGRWRAVDLDEIGNQRQGAETYGAVMLAGGAIAVRVRSDRYLSRLTVVTFADRRREAPRRPRRFAAGVAEPPVIARADWGADESLRYDTNGNEIWPPQFWPIQKVILHHTATANDDTNPAATVRAIYYYHAVTEGWGDIGYNFLIDEAGNVYEGRHSRDYAPGETPTGQDADGNGVTAGHAYGFNSGTVGIALLGTLNSRDATPAARASLEQLIAWIDGAHGIDPQGSEVYTNPVTGAQTTFPNIAGHRDVNATECPGDAFYATLPTVRDDVAALIAQSNGPTAAFTATPNPAAPGQAIAFDATSSTDPQGPITDYSWDFGDGVSDDAGAVASDSHTYTASGQYTVTLTVTDASGASAQTTQTVTVTDQTNP